MEQNMYLQFLREFIKCEKLDTKHDKSTQNSPMHPPLAQQLNRIFEGFFTTDHQMTLDKSTYAALLEQTKAATQFDIQDYLENMHSPNVQLAWKTLIDIHSELSDDPIKQKIIAKYIVETSPDLTLDILERHNIKTKLNQTLMTHLSTLHRKLQPAQFVILPKQYSPDACRDFIQITKHKNFSSLFKYTTTHQDQIFNRSTFERLNTNLMRNIKDLEIFVTDKKITEKHEVRQNVINVLQMLDDLVFDFIEIQHANEENAKLSQMKWSERLEKASTTLNLPTIRVNPIKIKTIQNRIASNPSEIFYIRSRGFGPKLSFVYTPPKAPKRPASDDVGSNQTKKSYTDVQSTQNV
jgi:hypothetical protein